MYSLKKRNNFLTEIFCLEVNVKRLFVHRFLESTSIFLIYRIPAIPLTGKTFLQVKLTFNKSRLRFSSKK